MTNFIGMWPILARAYEIALLGNFSLQLMFEKDYIKGIEDYPDIKKFFKGVEFKGKGDLIVRIGKPAYERLNKKYETIDTIHNRVEKAKQNTIPTEIKNDGGSALLDVAIERSLLSLHKREKAIEIAKIIAQLEKKKQVEAYHIAEATQYCYEEDCTVYNAESYYIQFGTRIKISLHDIEKEDIQNAINYLTSLLKKEK